MSLCNDLFAWYETDATRNPLMFPHRAPIADVGMPHGGSPGSIEPSRTMPPRLTSAHHAVSAMPSTMRIALLHKHVHGGFHSYHADTGLSRATFKTTCKVAYWYIAGWLQR